MGLTAEPRGKHAGIKLHLDEQECKDLLAGKALDFTKRVTKTISALLAENPDLLKARTQVQIVKALQRDQKKIMKQLSAINAGGDWKQVE
jgi:hypothetical protein